MDGERELYSLMFSSSTAGASMPGQLLVASEDKIRNQELKSKQEIQRRWKQGQATLNVVRVCRNAMEKVKAHLEFYVAEDMNNRKGFFKQINNRRKMWAHYGLEQGPW